MDEEEKEICSCGGDKESYKFDNKSYLLCRACWKEEVKGSTPGQDVPDAPLLSRMGMSEEDGLHPQEVISLNAHEEPTTPEKLEIGDHIMWRRPYVICHHALVKRIESNNEIEVFHWAPLKPRSMMRYQICKKTLKFDEQPGKLYKIIYDDAITEKNISVLVLERAKALEGLEDYHFFRRNCENFARFCKTGVNFNLQYPWLKRKLDQTAMSTLFKSMTAILFADLVKYRWSFRHHLMGSCIIVLLELISLLTDISNAYFQHKYPTSYIMPLKNIEESVIIRILEFIFGSGGMIIGFFAIERFCIYVGAMACPGMGTWVGFALGTLVFGILGGFVFGVAGKAFGNAVGIQIAQKLKEKNFNLDCFSGCIKSNKEPIPPTDAEAKMKKKKMVRRYLARSWNAQLGMILMIFSSVILFAFTRQYIKVYRDFRGSIKAKCVTKYITNLNLSYPCPAVHVRSLDSQSNARNRSKDQSEKVTNGTENTIQLFENERTFLTHTCSYQPRCRENDTKTAIEMEGYLNRFGFPNATFPCYYHPRNRSMVIRKLESKVLFINAFFWPIAAIFFGVGLIVYAMVRKRKKWQEAIRKKQLRQGSTPEKVETWFITLISVLGLTSYFYLLRWFRIFNF